MEQSSPFSQVTGMIEDDPTCRDQIAEWIETARVAHALEHNRLSVGVVEVGCFAHARRKF